MADVITFESVIAWPQGLNASVVFYAIVHVVQYRVLKFKTSLSDTLPAFSRRTRIQRRLWNHPHSNYNSNSTMRRVSLTETFNFGII